MDASLDQQVNILANQLTELSSCQGLLDWVQRVRAQESGIQLAIKNAEAQMEPVFKEKNELLQSLVVARAEFRRQPLLKRILDHHSAEKPIDERLSVIEQWLLSARTEIAEYQKLADLLNKLLSFAGQFGPTSLADKKRILAGLHSEKKELQIRKREITKSMTAIRQVARAASADAGKVGLFGLYDSSRAAAQRRGIRAVKENALQPHELEKAQVEDQIIGLDKHILFVEQFIS
jgi:hypothetical protein